MTNTQSWTLTFEPLGALLFRDDRPFNAGQHRLAVSRFPLPSVFRGAVRTALFEAADANFHKRPHFGLTDATRELLGDANTAETVDLRGPLVARALDRDQYECVLPWPGDVVITNADDPGRMDVEVMHARPPQTHAPKRLRVGPQHDGARTLGPMTGALPWTHTSTLPKPHGKPWLTVAGGQAYIEASTQKPNLSLHKTEHWIPQGDFLCQETRIGIARATEHSGEHLVASDSMLYTIITWRMAPRFVFAVEVSFERIGNGNQLAELHRLLRTLEGRLVRLGGKSGHARVRVLEHSIAPSWAQPDPAKAPPSSKLWLWTPGLYQPGSVPGLVAALGSSVQLGGFDMAKHRPRPLRTALDRGSVLWFSELDPTQLAEDQDRLAKEFDLPPASYGYGQWIPRSSP